MYHEVHRQADSQSILPVFSVRPLNALPTVRWNGFSPALFGSYVPFLKQSNNIAWCFSLICVRRSHIYSFVPFHEVLPLIYFLYELQLETMSNGNDPNVQQEIFDSLRRL